jgi:hypothetical protein
MLVRYGKKTMTERSENTDMQSDAATVELYLDRVRCLYDELQRWIANERGLSSTLEPSVVRERIGEYEVDRLVVWYAGQRLMDFAPVGARVVASAGRIDVAGTVDRAMLLYFDVEPAIRSVLTDDAGNVVREGKYPLFRDYTGPGWYWAVDARHREARRFDEAAFLEVLAEVSDVDIERA